MEPTARAVIGLPQYTGRNGVGPPFAEWLMRLETVIRERDLQNTIKFVEQGEKLKTLSDLSHKIQSWQ